MYGKIFGKSKWGSKATQGDFPYYAMTYFPPPPNLSWTSRSLPVRGEPTVARGELSPLGGATGAESASGRFQNQ